MGEEEGDEEEETVERGRRIRRTKAIGMREMMRVSVDGITNVG